MDVTATCPRCRSSLDAAFSFCPHCGASLSASPETARDRPSNPGRMPFGMSPETMAGFWEKFFRPFFKTAFVFFGLFFGMAIVLMIVWYFIFRQ